jgi:hypothetical protein
MAALGEHGDHTTRSGEMKARILIGIILLALVAPPNSHAFALFQYLYDGLFNQLGLDRGGIPKVVPNRYERPPIPQYYPAPKADQHDRIHIQAEGF